MIDRLKSRNTFQELDWHEISQILLEDASMCHFINWMEETGGEPTVILFPEQAQLVVVDFSNESPSGRRGVCYDEIARINRKKFPPEKSAVGLCEMAGGQLIDEQQYKFLQTIKPLDQKTSSWLLTPVDVRELGGALFGDCRYKRAFIYHNGADSYYASRAFRVYRILK